MHGIGGEKRFLKKLKVCSYLLFMKREQNSLIEIFCPLYEFSKYFCATFIFKSNLLILQRFKLFFRLAKLNLQLALAKPINNLRFLKKGKSHHKIGPAYKN